MVGEVHADIARCDLLQWNPPSFAPPEEPADGVLIRSTSVSVRNRAVKKFAECKLGCVPRRRDDRGNYDALVDNRRFSL